MVKTETNILIFVHEKSERSATLESRPRVRARRIPARRNFPDRSNTLRKIKIIEPR